MGVTYQNGGGERRYPSFQPERTEEDREFLQLYCHDIIDMLVEKRDKSDLWVEDFVKRNGYKYIFIHPDEY